jgi:nitrate/nitrite transport system ATP-binding protein
MALIELRGVGAGFDSGGRRRPVLHAVDLAIAEGEFVAIVGFSGSGKTTLLSILAGLLRPDRGSAWLDGQPLRGAGPDRALMFQSYALFPWLDVAANIRLAVDAVFPSWSRQRRRDHVDRHIDMVGLTAARTKKPGELSGGMRQRVALARALAVQPRVLLLDEPLGALDALTRGTLQAELARIWQLSGTTAVMVTNDVDEAILLADRVIPLTPGPGATLGPAFVVDLPRPRERAALNHDDRFRTLRNRILHYLSDLRRAA